MLLDLNIDHPSIVIKNKTLLAVFCAHNETSLTLHMNQFLQCNMFISKTSQHKKEIIGQSGSCRIHYWSSWRTLLIICGVC